MRREGCVGRPQQLYSLTEEADEHFPDNFAPVTAGLIEQMKKVLSPLQVEAAFCALAGELARELPAEELDQEQTEARLDRIAAFLNERGYLARWEKETHTEEDGCGEESYLLHTFNCPYAGVSADHPELCQMDLALVRELVGQPCQRLDSLAEAGHCCTYRIAANRVDEERVDEERVDEGERERAETIRLLPHLS